MDVMSTIESVFVRGLDQDNRPLTLQFAGQAAALFDGVVAPQRLEVSEGICESTVAYLTCLSTSHALPLDQFKGLPIEIGMVTDVGDLRRINVIVQEVRQGQSDGALTVLQLKAGDIFSVMDGRRSNRVFLNKSALDIGRIVLDGWRSRYPALADAFDYLLLDIDETQYPPRALTFQAHQSDSEFLRMLFKRNGISWFFRPGKDPLTQELVLFDDASQLPANSAGTINYHRRDGTEPFDTISLLSPTHTLVGGQVTRSSWDHETGEVDIAMETTVVDQGERGNDVASALVDARIELPHAGDTSDDHRRLTRVDMQRQEGRATCLHGVGGVRAQAVGEWNRIDGNAVLDALQPEDREYITVQLSTWCENNFPKELKDRVQNLLATSESGIRGWIARSNELPSSSPDTSQRHVNKFVAVRRDVPILPTWDPQVDLPRMNVMTATVVGAANTPVWCDELGRVKVSIHGLDPADHVHASGAGTNGDDGDSAWVRVNFLWCGDGFGVIFPLRPGMEVILGFEHGDPSRPMIIGTRYNATHMPPRFDHLDGLPNNAALSGIVTRELNGERQQQLRFNDTPGSISVQLGTDHAATQVNIGALSTPMDQGQTQPRGEGVEIRTDKAGAFRTAEAMLLSTWKRLQARGPAMDASEHLGLMKDFADLFKSLGDYAAQHQGLATDNAPTMQLQTDVQGGTEPVISLTAPAGLATTTPQTIMSYAGVNIDSVAMQHLQYTAGGYHVVNAGKGASLFAHEGGITSIAHHGKLLMQSQHDDTQIDSAKDIKLSAIGGKFVAMADKEIVLLLSSGTYLRLFDGGIEMGSQKPLTVKTDGHNWGGPGTMSADMPTFSDGDLGRTPRLLSPTSGQPVAGMQLHVQRDEGNLAGQTDAAGQGPKIKASGLQRLKSFFLDQRS